MRICYAVVLATIAGLSGCKDAEVVATEPAEDPCNYHADCTNGVCFEGQCHGTRLCIERSDCVTLPVCEGQRCICPVDEQRCLPICVTDNDCPADGQCLDGVCTPYPVQFDGVVPGGNTRGALQVGIARVELDTPVGVSMAGYGMRRGPQTPYRESLGGSNAWFDKPDVRAFVFSDGAEMLVLLRIPLSWSTDFMITDTARKVQERTGMNLLNNIITSATHSHSQPARFWHLVVDKYFGIFGYDEFDFEIFDRLTDSFADAVVMGIDDLQPAQFGWTSIEDFDPNNRISRDRRKQNNNLDGYMDKDRRMILMRIDDMAGNPRAILTHFGVHGTVFDYDNPIITGDAPGGVETALTEHATEKYGRTVWGGFIQGNGGDVSPGGDDRRHPDLERIQLIGERTWRVVEDEFDRLQTSANVPVSIVSGRIPITHEILGYGDGEFHDITVECEDSPAYFRFGAFQCVEGFPGNDDDPTTTFSDGDLNCVFAVECLTAGYAVPQFAKTRLSAAKLGTLAMITMPGEPVSQFGRDLSDRVETAVAGVDRAFVVGYSQDHHFYLLNEDDWWQGGYEPSRDIWGWRLGPYLTDHSVSIATQLAVEPAARVWDNQNLKPMFWDVPPERREGVRITDTVGDPAEILTDAPSTVRRMELVRFVWTGGHPGIDRPNVVLEKQDGASWAAVTRPGGVPYDDSQFEMIVYYDGKCGRSRCEDHKWRVHWEESRDFSLGRYRLSARGRAMKAGSPVEYTATSAPFDLVADDRLRVFDVRFDGNDIEGRIVDPAAVTFVPDGAGMKAEPIGHLLRSELMPARHGVPLAEGMMVSGSATIRDPNGMSHQVAVQVAVDHLTENRRVISGYDDGGQPRLTSAGELAVSRFKFTHALAPGAGDYYVQLTLTDPAGNSGTMTATITR